MHLPGAQTIATVCETNAQQNNSLCACARSVKLTIVKTKKKKKKRKEKHFLKHDETSMENRAVYNLSIEKRNVRTIYQDGCTIGQNADIAEGPNLDPRSQKNEKYEVKLNPEYVHGYCAGENNILKFSTKKIVYPFNNLIIIYDLFNKTQSIFSEHVNKVTLIRCKESGKFFLSAEEDRKKIRFLLWDKHSLKVLVNIKIKRKYFLDIDYIRDTDIVLLCRWNGKLILFIFSLTCFQKKKAKLKRQCVCVIKYAGDFYVRRGENVKCTEKKCTGMSNTLSTLERKCVMRRGGIRIGASRAFGKRCGKSDIHTILSAIKRRKRDKEKYLQRSTISLDVSTDEEKEYVKRVNSGDTHFVSVKKWEKGYVSSYYISFANSSHKWKNRNNRLLKNFKIFVDMNQSLCIYNEEHVFVYFLKNYIPHEKLNYKNFKCTTLSHGSMLSPLCRGLHFFSVFSLALFICKLLSPYCSRGEVVADAEMREDKSAGGGEHEKGKEAKNLASELCDVDIRLTAENSTNAANAANVPRGGAYGNFAEGVANECQKLLTDEISAIEVISLLFLQEDDDVNQLLKLQERGDKRGTIKKNRHAKLVEKVKQKKKEPKNAKDKEKNELLSKKYFIVGTKGGIVAIVNFLKPHKIVYLEKICSECILSIFIFQNDISILTRSGILFFMNVSNFSIYKSVDMYEMASINHSPVTSNKDSIMHDKPHKVVKEGNLLNSFGKCRLEKYNNKGKKMGVHMKRNRYGTKERNSHTLYEEKGENSCNNNISQNEEKYKNFVNIQKRYVCAWCSLDMYTLVSGTSLNEIVIYNLVTNEACFIFRKSYKINCFLLQNDDIVYSINNCIYKMSLTHYSDYFMFLAIPNVSVTTFLFFSDDLLMCGTQKGNLYFFSISNGRVKVINKVLKGAFEEERKKLPRNVNGEKRDILFSIEKYLKKSYITTRNCKGKESHGEKIIGLIMNKSKKNLLCVFENGIFLFRLHVTGNEKIDLKFVHFFDISNIVHVRLVSNFDNLFYVVQRSESIGDDGTTSPENGSLRRCLNRGYTYIYHLCSFNAVKIKKSKMNTVYMDILFYNTWYYEFAYYDEEDFVLLENKMMKGKNKCVSLLNSSTFVIYSFDVRKPANCNASLLLQCVRKEVGEKHTLGKIIAPEVCNKKSFSGKVYHLGELKKEKHSADESVQVGSGEVGSGEVGGGEVGSGEVGSDEVGSDEVGSDEVGSDEVGSDEVGSDEVGSGEVGSGEVGSGEEGRIGGCWDRHGSVKGASMHAPSNERQESEKGGPFVKLRSTRERENYVKCIGNIVNSQNEPLPNNVKFGNKDSFKNYFKLKKKDENVRGKQADIDGGKKKKNVNYTKYKLLRNILQKRKNIEFGNYKTVISENDVKDKGKSHQLQRHTCGVQATDNFVPSFGERGMEEKKFYGLHGKREEGWEVRDQQLVYGVQNSDSYEGFCLEHDRDAYLRKDSQGESVTSYLRTYLGISMFEHSKIEEPAEGALNYECNDENYDYAPFLGKCADNRSSLSENISGGIESIESGRGSCNSPSGYSIIGNKRNALLPREGKVLIPQKELGKTRLTQNGRFVKRNVPNVNCVHGGRGESETIEDNRNARYNGNFASSYNFNGCGTDDARIKSEGLRKSYFHFKDRANQGNERNTHHRKYEQGDKIGCVDVGIKNSIHRKNAHSQFDSGNSFERENNANKFGHIKHGKKMHTNIFVRNIVNEKELVLLRGKDERCSFFNGCKIKVNENVNVRSPHMGNSKFEEYTQNIFRQINDTPGRNTLNGRRHVVERMLMLSGNSMKKCTKTPSENSLRYIL
ncbi:conserved Plasmodium protein, unknown function [Plasmodium ovale wallikeri]|uniref:WD repeat-containing protein n=1 Tax=Plasmodium ovale wallikeri TaxID=864142 RepID=A0A1A8YJL7_PLAOA|nr:conserved Plasmodium protein, unknown function [Plasmodium ovale wallikeri]